MATINERVLTQASVRRLCARNSARTEYADTVVPNLKLIVQPSGVKSWAVRTQIGKKSVKLTIGSATALLLPEARQRARKLLEQVTAGVDPRKVRAAQAANTVELVVSDWLRRDQSNKRTGKQVKALFDKNVLPFIGNRSFVSLTTEDAQKVVDRIEDRGSIIMARRVQSYLSQLFKWAVGRKIITSNPLINVPKPGNEKSRERWLSDGELREVWNAAIELGWPYGPVLQMLILTGSRRGEIAGLRWNEVDRDGILLPGERVKRLPRYAHVSHYIPLSEQALALLDSLPRIAPPKGGPAFVFTTTGRLPPTNWDRTLKRLDRIIRARREAEGREPMARWTIHDLRRSTVTGMQALGVPFDVIEATIGHVGMSRRGVAGAYRRFAYETEKREALAQWGAHVAALVEEPIISCKRLSPEAAAAMAAEQTAAVDPRIPESYRGLGSKVVMREDGDGAGFVIGGSRPMTKG